jgi:hypothetical protein
MKFSVFVISVMLFFIGSAQPNLEWINHFGNSSGYHNALNVKLDNHNNSYVVGYFNDIIDFDYSASTFTLGGPYTKRGFILKLDVAGKLVWAKEIVGSNYFVGTCNKVAVDKYNNVFVSGNFQGTADLDPGSGTYTVSSSQGQANYVLKLDSAGNFKWGGLVGGSVSDITVDTAGRVVLVGNFQQFADFDPTPSVYSMSPSGSSDMFLLCLSSSGGLVYCYQFGSNGSQFANAVSSDNEANVYFSGYFNGSLDFDPGGGVASYSSTNSAGFVCKITTHGSFGYLRSFAQTPTRGFTRILQLAVTAQKEIIVAGTFQDSCDLDPGTGLKLFASLTNSLADIFVARIDSLGNSSWIWQLTGNKSRTVSGLVLDPSEAILISGHFLGNLDFDPGPGQASAVVTNTILPDFFLAKYTKVGSLQWFWTSGTSTDEDISSIACRDTNSVFGVGFFNDTLDFEPGTGQMTFTASPARHIYIMKLSQCIPPEKPIDTTPQQDLKLCGHGSVTLTCASSDTVLWFTAPVGGQAIANGSTFVSSTLSTNTIFYIASKSCGLSYFRTPVTVSVFPVPVITYSISDSQICEGEEVMIDADGADTFIWKGVFVSNGDKAVVYATYADSYTLSGIGPGGCQSTETIQLSVQNCMGLQQLIREGISIYPNPASMVINYRIGLPCEIKLLDGQGRTIAKEYSSDGFGDIDIHGISPGVYTINVKSGSNNIRKVIVKN